MSNGDGVVTRSSHIKRIYKNDDPETDMWVDIERLDELRFLSEINYPWQEKVWQFDWGSFDPNGTDADGNPIQLKTLQDPNDPANVIKVPVRNLVHVNEGRDFKWQGYKHYFLNDETNNSRETHSRRVFHYDISADQLDSDQNPPSDPQEYLNALGDKDDGQYIEVEILDKYWTTEHQGRDSHGNIKPATWQEKKWILNSNTDQLLADQQGETSWDNATINPDAGPRIDPPWRLDPLQNIVNVNWGGLAVIFGAQDDDAPPFQKG